MLWGDPDPGAGSGGSGGRVAPGFPWEVETLGSFCAGLCLGCLGTQFGKHPGGPARGWGVRRSAPLSLSFLL